MELDIDLRLTQPFGDPRFDSSETDAAFFIFGYLPGCSKNNINVSISDDETEIVILGEKEEVLTQELAISRRLAIAFGISSGRFSRAFPVPLNAVLDRTEVVFHEDASILIVAVPKSVRELATRDDVQDFQIAERELKEEDKIPKNGSVEQEADERKQEHKLLEQKAELNQDFERKPELEQQDHKPTVESSKGNMDLPAQDQNYEARIGEGVEDQPEKAAKLDEDKGTLKSKGRPEQDKKPKEEANGSHPPAAEPVKPREILRQLPELQEVIPPPIVRDTTTATNITPEIRKPEPDRHCSQLGAHQSPESSLSSPYPDVEPIESLKPAESELHETEAIKSPEQERDCRRSEEIRQESEQEGPLDFDSYDQVFEEDAKPMEPVSINHEISEIDLPKSSKSSSGIDSAPDHGRHEHSRIKENEIEIEEEQNRIPDLVDRDEEPLAQINSLSGIEEEEEEKGIGKSGVSFRKRQMEEGIGEVLIGKEGEGEGTLGLSDRRLRLCSQAPLSFVRLWFLFFIS